MRFLWFQKKRDNEPIIGYLFDSMEKENRPIHEVNWLHNGAVLIINVFSNRYYSGLSLQSVLFRVVANLRYYSGL